MSAKESAVNRANQYLFNPQENADFFYNNATGGAAIQGLQRLQNAVPPESVGLGSSTDLALNQQNRSATESSQNQEGLFNKAFQTTGLWGRYEKERQRGFTGEQNRATRGLQRDLLQTQGTNALALTKEQARAQQRLAREQGFQTRQTQGQSIEKQAEAKRRQSIIDAEANMATAALQAQTQRDVAALQAQGNVLSSLFGNARQANYQYWR